MVVVVVVVVVALSEVKGEGVGGGNVTTKAHSGAQEFYPEAGHRIPQGTVPPGGLAGAEARAAIHTAHRGNLHLQHPNLT